MRKIGLLCFVVAFLIFHTSAVYAQDYIVGEGDVLKITVYDHTDLTTVERVSGDGAILFPLIGEVRVGGLMISEISVKIASLLADGYIIDPQVSVFIEEFRSKKAVVIGEVNNPGLYVLHGQITFLELLSKAGGLTKDAGDKAVIKRKSGTSEEGEERVIINMKRLVEEGDLSGDAPIMDGDSIYIDKAGVFYATGEVKKPDAYRYEEGLTVVKAITMAGGFTEKAAAGRVKIMRKKHGKEEILEKVKMDERVLPEDVIIVPESFF
jgi:polysaccharide export outer membrane protein